MSKTVSHKVPGSEILCAYCNRDFRPGRSFRAAQRVRDAHEAEHEKAQAWRLIFATLQQASSN